MKKKTCLNCRKATKEYLENPFSYCKYQKNIRKHMNSNHNVDVLECWESKN